MFPASDANAPFGMRIATVGMCSNESGIERSRTFTGASVFATSTLKERTHSSKLDTSSIRASATLASWLHFLTHVTTGVDERNDPALAHRAAAEAAVRRSR